MPKAFLLTRYHSACSYREKRHSDDDKSDSGSDHEIPYTNFGSPDSGYSASPVSMTIRDSFFQDRDNNNVATPLNLSNVQHHHSPLYFSAFDKLSLCNDNSPHRLAGRNDNNLALSPSSPNRKRSNAENDKKTVSNKKPKAARKINFDIDKTSPVSGTIIRDFSDSDDDGGRIVCGDIEPTYNYVEVTPEARAELEKIENKIGDYICQLCKDFFEDAFQLAQHRCSRIVHVEYRCPECDKVFNCPANLASHRRWHKPKSAGPNPLNKTASPAKILPAARTSNETNNNTEGLDQAAPHNGKLLSPVSPSSHDSRDSPCEEGQFECDTCGKRFRRQAYLRKHIASHANEKPLPCQFCGKIFLNETSRAKHEAQHSTGNKDLACASCNLTFPNKIVLEKHVRTHTKDVFTCKYCTSTFYSSPGLTRHINKCHPSENRQVILLQLPNTRPC